MYLKIVSDVFAFLLGCILVGSPISNNSLSFSLDSILIFITDPDNLMYFVKALFSGGIALAVKVGGDIILHRWKERKQKGGKVE